MKKLLIIAIAIIGLSPLQSYAAILGTSAIEGDTVGFDLLDFNATIANQPLAIIHQSDFYGGYLNSVSLAFASTTPSAAATVITIRTYTYTDCTSFIESTSSPIVPLGRIANPPGARVTYTLSIGLSLAATRCITITASNSTGMYTVFGIDISPSSLYGIDGGYSVYKTMYAVFNGSAYSNFGTTTPPDQIYSFDTSSCNPVGDLMSLFGGTSTPFSLAECLAVLFGWPDAAMSSQFSSINTKILYIWPFGYVTRFGLIAAGTATSTFPSIVIGLPNSIGGYDTSAFYSTTTYNIQSAMTAAEGVLNTPDSNGYTLWGTIMPLWELFCYLMLVIAIIWHFITHRHMGEDKRKIV